jgi:hypothetical protein
MRQENPKFKASLASLSRPYLKIKLKSRVRDVAQWYSTCSACVRTQGSILSIAKQKNLKIC